MNVDISGIAVPVTGAVRSGNEYIPVIDLPQVSDEEWNAVAVFQKYQEVAI